MRRELIQLPPETRPILTAVIHTEEEFDWGKPHDRHATGVEHMRHISRAQEIFDEHGIVPNYVVDYPIASQDAAIRRDCIQLEGACHVPIAAFPQKRQPASMRPRPFDCYTRGSRSIFFAQNVRSFSRCSSSESCASRATIRGRSALLASRMIGPDMAPILLPLVKESGLRLH